MSSFAVFGLGAVMLALASWWGMRAYARADAGSAPASPRNAMIAVALASAAVLGMYLYLGRPDLPGAAYADRMAALAERPLETYTPDEIVAVLHARAKQDPESPEPLLVLAGFEAQMGRAQEALRAYDEALRRDPNSYEATLGVGLVLFAQSQGEVSAQAQSLFERAREMRPEAVEPVFYLAIAAEQAGRVDEAQALWRQARAMMTPDDPRIAMIDQMLAVQR